MKKELKKQNFSEIRRKDLLSGFTLMELIVVIIIIGVLAGTMVPVYNRNREKAHDKQAQAILSLIRSAQKVYWTERRIFYTPGSTTLNTINMVFNLDLPNDGNWGEYSMTNTNGFTASVRRDRANYNRIWSISAATENATCSGTCP